MLASLVIRPLSFSTQHDWHVLGCGRLPGIKNFTSTWPSITILTFDGYKIVAALRTTETKHDS